MTGLCVRLAGMLQSILNNERDRLLQVTQDIRSHWRISMEVDSQRLKPDDCRMPIVRTGNDRESVRRFAEARREATTRFNQTILADALLLPFHRTGTADAVAYALHDPAGWN